MISECHDIGFYEGLIIGASIASRNAGATQEEMMDILSEIVKVPRIMKVFPEEEDEKVMQKLIEKFTEKNAEEAEQDIIRGHVGAQLRLRSNEYMFLKTEISESLYIEMFRIYVEMESINQKNIMIGNERFIKMTEKEQFNELRDRVRFGPYYELMMREDDAISGVLRGITDDIIVKRIEEIHRNEDGDK